jgi:hypothetical protein
MAVNTMLNHCEKMHRRYYVDIEDLLWQLPIRVKFKQTVLNVDTMAKNSTILEIDNNTFTSINDIESINSYNLLNFDSKKRQRPKNSILDY